MLTFHVIIKLIQEFSIGLSFINSGGPLLINAFNFTHIANGIQDFKFRKILPVNCFLNCFFSVFEYTTHIERYISRKVSLLELSSSFVESSGGSELEMTSESSQIAYYRQSLNSTIPKIYQRQKEPLSFYCLRVLYSQSLS